MVELVEHNRLKKTECLHSLKLKTIKNIHRKHYFLEPET